MRAILLLLFISILCLTAPSSSFGRVTVTADASSTSLQFQSDTILDLPDTVRYELADCAMVAEVCIGTPLDEISNYQITVNGAAYTNGIGGCNYDTTRQYSYSSLFGQGNVGDYILQSWEVNGSIFSAPFSSINQLVDSLNVWDPTGNWVNDPANLLITGGTPGSVYSDMIIWVLTIAANNVLTVDEYFYAEGTVLLINSGLNELVVTESISGASDMAVIIASCIQHDTVQLPPIIIGESSDYCFDLSELPGSFVSMTNECFTNKVNLQFTNGETCIDFTGTAVGADEACFVACDDLGYCDTTTVLFTVIPETGITELYDTIQVGETQQWCVDPSTFAGSLNSITNDCEGDGGTTTFYSVNETTYCVDYTGLVEGNTDRACIIVCDDLSSCDTTFINVTVRRSGPAYYFDTLYINQQSSFCDWDESNLFGPVTDIQNACPGNSGTEVFFGTDNATFCMDYEALSPGKDSACIVLTDNLGNTDTTIAVVCVIPPMMSTITDIIRLTTNAQICLDTTELAGTIISAENICEEDSGESVDFLIDTDNYCVDISPISLGTDSACIVLCDNFGVCDTTLIIITVSEEDLDPPITLDDIDTTEQNVPIVIDACLNDTIPDVFPLTNFFVLPVASGGEGPNNGTAFSNADCTVSYTPLDDFCGTDVITYVSCNEIGCDTANITVVVLCPSQEFQIFNAFSPNGDGINDAFKINGLDQFPDHELRVYNRWGNEVLVQANYQSDWEGEWQGLDLPDGTYFYLLDLGTGETRTGYVYISR